MKLELAKSKTLELMQQHGLIEKGWKFSWNKRNSSFGLCSYRNKEIQLSLILTELNHEDSVKNTILHEIAHALVGPGHNHDYVWFSKAKSLGCTGQRCTNAIPENEEKLKEYNKKIEQKFRYKAVCPVCKKETPKRSIPKRSISCGVCCKSYNPKYLLEIIDNQKVNYIAEKITAQIVEKYISKQTNTTMATWLQNQRR